MGLRLRAPSSPQRVSAQQIVQVAHLLLHPTVSRAAAFEAEAVKFSARAPGGISSEDQVPRSLRVINSHVKSHIIRPGVFLFKKTKKKKSILIVLPIPLFFSFQTKLKINFTGLEAFYNKMKLQKETSESYYR